MISLNIDGVDYSPYLLQDSYIAPITAVMDNENAFTALDGTENVTLLGYQQTLSFTLSRLDDEALGTLFQSLYGGEVAVSFNSPISRNNVPCICTGAEPVNLRSAGTNLWQVNVNLKCNQLLRSDSL